MTSFGYHASHEQFSPSELLTYVRLAEAAGFQSAMCSDHFHPWSNQQGQSGFAWSWLGSALEATSLPFGTVCAPGQRYHPAVIAQAAATLQEMYPDRFWLALGSGQDLNEHITGDRWPPKSQRQERLRESVEVMRSLWRGETVSHVGQFTVDEAKLYTLPESAPLVVGAAITPETANWVGSWADALITISHPLKELRRVIDAFHDGGGKGKPLFLQCQLSYGRTYEDALEAAHDQWRTNILGSNVLSDLRMPVDFEAAAQFIDKTDMAEDVIVSTDLKEFIDRLQQLSELGFAQIFLHNVHRDQQTFIHDFGSLVLPELI